MSTVLSTFFARINCNIKCPQKLSDIHSFNKQIRRKPVKQSSGIVVYPMFNHLNSLMREFADVCAFRNESSYQFVCIFVWTPFPGTVWMSIKYFRTFALYYRRTLDSLKIKVFTAIVTGNCFEGFPEFFAPIFRSILSSSFTTQYCDLLLILHTIS